ncbi:MAG: FkbM family methyltransferase [Litorilinea sp.]
MITALTKKVRNFGNLWQEVGMQQSLKILRAKIRLARIRSRAGNETLHRHHIEALGLPMYLDLTDQGLSKTLFYRGVHEPIATQWVKEELTPGMTVIDIGANIGYYVLLAASKIGPQGKIYAIEPVASTIAILRKNLELNHLDNVVTECVALSSHAGEATMQVTEKRNWASLAHENLKSDRAVSAQQGTYETITVPTKTLDRFVEEHEIGSVNFLRMDVEGYETEIIQGASQTLAAHRPLKLFMEVHPFFARDMQPFVQMINTLYDAGLGVKYIGYHRDVVMSWPDRETVINYLSQETFGEAPHLLFASQ